MGMKMPTRRVVTLLLAVGLMVVGGGADDAPRAEEAAQPAPTTGEVIRLSAPEDAEASTSSNAPTSPPTLNTLIPPGRTAAIIRLEGGIYDFTATSLDRRVDRAIADGADLIVLEIDTLGGRADSALEIGKFMRQLTQRRNVPTVVWVNDKAYSAGTIIAAACNVMVMSNSSYIGDCAPIFPGSSLAPTERAKALSPLIAEFRDSARVNGYDYPLLHAMLVLGVQVFYIEHTLTGEQRFVNQADYMVMVDGETLDPGHWDKWRRDNPTGVDGVGQVSPETALESDRGMWKPVTKLPSGRTVAQGQVHNGLSLLTISETEAMDYGLARGVADTPAQLQQLLGASSISYVNITWSEELARILLLLPVRAVLVAMLIIGAFVELKTPGLGLGGAVALGALVLLLAPPVVIGLAEVWELVLFFVGLALLLVEIFIIPGFGVFGVVGLFLMFNSLVLVAVQPIGSVTSPNPDVLRALQHSAMVTLVGIVLGAVAMAVLMRYFGSIPLMRHMVLEADPQQPRSNAQHVSGDEAIGGGAIKPGDAGRSVVRLRPTGRAEIDGRIVDVVTAGEFIDADMPIRVTEIHGNRIVVESDDAA